MTGPIERELEPSGACLFQELAQPSVGQLREAQQAHLARKRSQGAARVQEPNRAQVELRASDLESLLGEGHRARLV